MRCLQCGKDVPLLKRLAGSEFCSDAHRREYKEEYSQLALGRLLQAKPSELVNHSPDVQVAVPVPAPAAAPAPVIKKAPATGVLNGAPPAPNPNPARVRTEINGTKTIPAAAKVEPRAAMSQPKRAQPQPAPVQPMKQAAQEPAVAVATNIQKPAPVALRMAVVVTAEFERALTSLTPDQPLRHASMSAAALAQGSPLPMEHRIEIADSVAHPVKRELELRDSTRAAPRFDLDLGIVAPESFGSQRQPLSVPQMSVVAPAEAALWTAVHRDFTGSVVSLGDFANFQLSTIGFEEPAPADAGGSAVLAVENEPSQEAASEPKAEPAPSAVEVPIPPPVLIPLPVAVQAIAAAKHKPVQVFGGAHFSDGTVQIPQPTGLPLRPTMVLAPGSREAETAPVVTVKKRDAGVRILPPPVTVRPSMPIKPLPAAGAEPDLGLPELRFKPSDNRGASQTRRIVAIVAGAATLAIGGFLFLGNQKDTGSKPVVAVTTPVDRWIADFAPDAKRERKVSVLRSSMDLPAYRLEFESSMQIKGFGWVYRAQDARNFYVSKIELQRPGQNPAFVIAHYAVINGVDQPRAETPLKSAVPLGAHYKVRFEAVGDRFTTWVQDQKVDEWTDRRLKTGGAGLYHEGVEQSTLYGDFQVTPLTKEK